MKPDEVRCLDLYGERSSGSLSVQYDPYQRKLSAWPVGFVAQIVTWYKLSSTEPIKTYLSWNTVDGV
jgi:hypothetical protein